MFSQLGPLFKTSLRQAEAADTRLEIRRDDKQGQDRKQEQEGESGEPSALWDDSTTVSLESLRSFLIEFLKSKGEALSDAEMRSPAQAEEIYIPARTAPLSTAAARAVKAYTSHAVPAAPVPPPAEEPTPDVDLASLLKADEIRTMHQLIQELDHLFRHGIHTLTIEKAGTFLEALVEAVRAEKARL